MTLDLTDDEAAALARVLRRVIDDDRFPHSPRMAPLRAILGKLEPPVGKPEPPPPLTGGDAPSSTLGAGGDDEALPWAPHDVGERRPGAGPLDRMVSRLRTADRS